MKEIVTIIALLIFSNIYSQNKAIISGKIENSIKDSVSISIANNLIGTKSKIYSSKIDSNGRFKIIIPLTKSKEAFLVSSKKNIGLFISPNDSIYCTYNDNAIYKSINFEGNNSDQYNYFIKYYNDLGLHHGQFFMPDYSDVFNMKPIEFKKYRKEKVEKDLMFLKDYSSSNFLNDEFKQYAEIEIKYSYYYGLLSYHSFKNYFKKIDEKLPNNFYQDINNELFQNDDYLSSDDYIQATKMYINEMNVGVYTTPKEYFPKAIEVSSKLLSGKTLFNYQLNLLSEMLQTDASTKLKDSLIPVFLNKCPIEKYNSIITDNYKKNIYANSKSLPQNVLKSIFETEEKKEITFEKILKKYKNKAIYIDVWASWCGPCKIEMPYSMTLIDKFKNDDVVFIYLSIDKNIALWKKAIINWNIKGEHYVIKNGLKSEFSKHFNIYGVPHYILIDKNGKVIFPSAVRPSSKSIEPSIRTLL